jgi:hypothetical protein
VRHSSYKLSLERLLLFWRSALSAVSCSHPSLDLRFALIYPPGKTATHTNRRALSKPIERDGAG